jgi:hypothetical protein
VAYGLLSRDRNDTRWGAQGYSPDFRLRTLEQYNGFFAHEWAHATQDAIPPKLADAFSILCLAWKEASNTHRMPWLMVHQMKEFAKGLLGSHKPHISQLIEEFKNWMLRELNGALQRSEKKAVNASIKKIDQRLRLSKQQRDFEFPAMEYWKDIVTKSEIQLSISGSQNLAYCGLVFAYEWFVVNCFRALGGAEKERPNWPTFWTLFQSKLKSDPKTVYWDDRPVMIAREVRNCIAHLGGKVKPALLAEKPEIAIGPEGLFTVMPADNHKLFAVLKLKVSQLIEEARPLL